MSQPTDDRSTNQLNLDARHLTYFVGLFFLVGVGIGVTGFLSMGYFTGGGGLGESLTAGFLMLVTLIIAFSVGPVLGVIVANDLHTRVPTGDNAYLSTFVGGAIGYLVMALTVTIILLLGVALLGGGGVADGAPTGPTGDNPLGTLLNLLGAMILLSLPTGLVCAGTVYATEEGLLGERSPTPAPAGTTREPPSAGHSEPTEPADVDTSDRPEDLSETVVDHFRVTRGFGLGVLAALIVSALVVGIIAIEPFGEDAVPLVPPYTPVNVLRIYSWFILMAHGVDVSGFTLEIMRSSLLQAAPVVGIGIAGWVGGKLWGRESYLLGAVSGSSTVVGYVVFIAALAIIAPAEVDPTAQNIEGTRIHVDLLATTFTVGIVYPLLIGAAGGVVAAFSREG